MRFLVVLLAILALSQAAPREPKRSNVQLKLLDAVNYLSKNGRVLEDPMTNFLYCVRDHMTTGIPEFDVPSFNPLRINAANLTLGAFEVCTGTISVEDVVVSLFDTFVVSFISGTVGLIPPRFELVVELTWKTLSASTAYDLLCNTSDDVVFGTGTVEAEAVGVRSLIDFVIHILPDIDLDDASFGLSMDRFTEFRITGLRDDEEHSENVSRFFYENGDEILQSLDSVINDIFKKIVGNLFGETQGVEDGGLIEFLINTCLVM